jgi:hypothetical protein
MLQWVSKIMNSKKIIIKYIPFLMIVFLFSIFIIPSSVFAQDPFGLGVVEDSTLLGAEDIRVTIAKIIRAILSFLGIIAICLVLYAGFTIMTSKGDERKVTAGKKILVNAFIGLVIILSAFVLNQFILFKLAEATGYNLTPGVGSGTGVGNFSSSGALGNIVNDHYPLRDQRNVPRNTKISVSFNLNFEPSSVFDDHNGSGTLGDCIDPSPAPFSWNDHCDHILPGVIRLNSVDFSTDPPTVSGDLDMAGITTLDVDGRAFNIVMTPILPLGTDSDPVNYRVILTSNIQVAGGGSMFATDADGEYRWNFETGTEFDFTPPRVTSVYPIDGSNVARNTIIQINFSEPMDPSVSQGETGTYYHIIFDGLDIEGKWNISNGYRTVEFVSNQECGENSCGEQMYCLPSGCPLGDDTCSELRRILIRTADLINAGSFEAVPFSGFTDMSGNALDGGNFGVADGKPAMGATFEISTGEENPDNYIWGFNVQNLIDKTAPYIIQVSPGIDTENVAPDAEHFIRFSKPMWIGTLKGIGVMEYGLATPMSFWRRISAEVSGGETRVDIDHRDYGPNDEDAYYFTYIPESVKSLNQNCVYPGYGPYSATPSAGASPECVCTADDDGILTCPPPCTTVSTNPAEDTACVQTASAPDLLFGDVDTCLDRLDDPDISPVV